MYFIQCMTESTLANRSTPETILLRPTRGWTALKLKDLWRYRELIFFLTWRDIKVRYKQTILGMAWAIIRPVISMVVYSLIFGQLANLDSEGVPYTIFTYVALLPWQLFSKAMSDTGRSMVSNRNMITKIYFPRLVIPISTVLSGLVDFFIAFLVLIGMMIYYKISVTAAIWTLPLLFAYVDHSPGSGIVVFVSQRALPRCRIYATLPDRDVEIPHSCGLFGSIHYRCLEDHLFPESHGWCCARLSLGLARHRTGCFRAYDHVDFHRCGNTDLDYRFVLFSAHGKIVCGYGLTDRRPKTDDREVQISGLTSLSVSFRLC